MADDNNFQNRMNNPSDRGAAPNGQGADPLAELARLIGQNDPFSEFGREPRAAAPAPPPQRPVPNEQQLVDQPYTQTFNQQPAASYQPEHDVQAFAQATREAGNFREAAYRDTQQSPPSDDFYEEAEPSGRSRGRITVMAVIALAVVGTVSAFGYRFIFSGSDSTTPPPVIRANTDPTKVPPPVASGDSSQGKLTYERVGDGNQGQRVVSREEQPVDPKDLNRPNVSRTPPPGSANQWASAVTPSLPPGSSTSAVTSQSAAFGEPKKVRTVPLRPEPTEANMAPPSMYPPASSQPSANIPNSRSAPGMANAPTFAPPSARTPAASNQMTPPSANAPLSLNDDAAPAMPRMTTPPAVQPRQAAAPRPAPAPPQEIAAPRSLPPPSSQAAVVPPRAGGYLVQLSSQRSEAEAQTALRGLQAKFPSVLGGQQATIRRAELGERGVFFRAMVGPFASRELATQLCGNLKAAGGDCIVQGN